MKYKLVESSVQRDKFTKVFDLFNYPMISLPDGGAMHIDRLTAVYTSVGGRVPWEPHSWSAWGREGSEPRTVSSATYPYGSPGLITEIMDDECPEGGQE